MDPSNPTLLLTQFVERLRAARQYWRDRPFEPVPEPPPEPLPNRYKLQFRPGYAAYRPVVTLEIAREQIETAMRTYLENPRPGRNLLIQAQPGVGKTHMAVKIAQRYALAERRILYAMQNHKHFETIMAMEHVEPDRWYHWLALTAESPATGNPMCQHSDGMLAWTQKGYPAMKLCDSLCSFFKPNCEFRRQALREERIIAGTHDHVALGMQISDFDVAFVDELPLAAFLRPRHVPLDGLRLDGVGPVVDLSRKLHELAAGVESKRDIKGKALLDQIGELLDDAYAAFDVGIAAPIVPWVSREADIERAPWWYMLDLLLLLVPEKAAWEAGQTQWLPRAALTSTGLDLLKRADPWERLPAHTIFLDATGSGEIYRQLFDRDVEVFTPNVERRGKVYQVVGRLNGISTLLERVPGERSERRTPRRRLAKQGLEALEWCRQMIVLTGAQAPGCVTFMDAVPEFEEVFGKGRVLHYFAQRGSNDLIDADAGFVIGAPQPADDDLMRMVTMIRPDRIQPYHWIEADGQRHPARGEELRTYQYFDERGQAERLISGFWSDRDLNTMADVLREQEIVQAIHRFRPITRAVPVYVLTSIPTAEPLTGIYDTYAEALEGIAGVPTPTAVIEWRDWLRIYEWLGQMHAQGRPVGYEALAQATGRNLKYLRDRKWLDVIAATLAEQWQSDRISPVNRTGGPAEKAIRPIVTPHSPLDIS